ncbi:hypothetical protein EJ05DRAFT_478293 [Pseudovirgaria hyperparasitica]|uniref:dihydroneopterin aldolase n=1 Tax=Pseudovirgaria hyperparasitica TaxID=470096 RepID=A0A6A6W162_9PEZI|nr:uncharacterized protein EJ05DRAFT_478293 [Pseudovirgaria hyperparasitica]KAF2756283.1 hypothetical protein EJ05DRAFT_478293 [Pseudovirgaria hyperparasitica]
MSRIILPHHEIVSRIPYVADKVIVKNLRVTANAGYDSWGREKSQPALISITLTLDQQFASAAQTDTVDGSTVHYGKLSKRLMATVGELSGEWRRTWDLADFLYEAATEVAGSSQRLAACEIEICYPKASMLGEGAGARYCFLNDGAMSCTVFLRNVRVPCIIGVNSHERVRKQLVVANVWVDNVSGTSGEVYSDVEKILTETMEKSSFETLESLATTFADDCKTGLSHQLTSLSTIRLQVEKPVAVPFADAPVIEIIRRV